MQESKCREVKIPTVRFSKQLLVSDLLKGTDQSSPSWHVQLRELSLLFAQEYPITSLSAYCGVITSDLTE